MWRKRNEGEGRSVAIEGKRKYEGVWEERSETTSYLSHYICVCGVMNIHVLALSLRYMDVWTDVQHRERERERKKEREREKER